MTQIEGVGLDLDRGGMGRIGLVVKGLGTVHHINGEGGANHGWLWWSRARLQVVCWLP